MSTVNQSLRWVIEKWFGADLSACIRLTRAGQSCQRQCRCVRVEAARQSGPFSILFFRHEDGSWYVFPPGGNRPAIGIARHAAASSPNMFVGARSHLVMGA